LGSSLCFDFGQGGLWVTSGVVGGAREIPHPAEVRRVSG